MYRPLTEKDAAREELANATSKDKTWTSRRAQLLTLRLLVCQSQEQSSGLLLRGGVTSRDCGILFFSWEFFLNPEQPFCKGLFGLQEMVAHL